MYFLKQDNNRNLLFGELYILEISTHTDAHLKLCTINIIFTVNIIYNGFLVMC